MGKGTVLGVLALGVTTWAHAADVGGKWIVEIEHGGERVMAGRAAFSVADGKLAGKAGRSSVRGSVSDNDIAMEFVSGKGDVEISLKGSAEGERLTGTGTAPNGLTYNWIAYRDPSDSPQGARTHQFTPTTFERYFTSATKPVLRIRAGDTVSTWSVDAGGTDPSSKRRTLGGNPLTGPFFVEGALPGDTLVVKLNRVRTNRDWAHSGSGLMSNTVSPDYMANQKRAEKFSSRWRLDAQAGVATLDTPTEALKNFRVPLDPMVGCVAVAPPGQQSIPTRDSGWFGGNMDYNRIREGTTVYLPVSHPGALLFIGDGHAAQGDGELTGDALETSMDIEFTVDVIRDRVAPVPYAEDAEYWMAIGISGSLDEALRKATTMAARYLETEYGLNSTEAAVVLGFALKYDIADLVGTQVSVVAKIPQKTLAQLPRRKQP